MSDWYKKSAEQVLSELNTNPHTGLSNEEAEAEEVEEKK